MTTYIGIDGGITGALTAIHPDDTWQLKPVTVFNTGKVRLLDVPASLAFIQEVAQRADGIRNLVVVFKHAKKNRLFGTKGNFANGRHTEFWRVLLTMAGISFLWVDPNTCQADVFRGIAGTDTKTKAMIYLQRRYPLVRFDDFTNRSQLEDVRDAMCIACWVRSNLK